MVVNGNSHLINRSFSIAICGKTFAKMATHTEPSYFSEGDTTQLSENGKTHQKKEIECHLTRYHAQDYVKFLILFGASSSWNSCFFFFSLAFVLENFYKKLFLCRIVQWKTQNHKT